MRSLRYSINVTLGGYRDRTPARRIKIMAMKRMLLTLAIACLLSCSGNNPFERAAKKLSEPDGAGVCCGYDKEWVRLEKGEYPRSAKEDEAQCVATLSETVFSKISEITATVMLLECMRKLGWKLEISEWVITS